MQEVIIERLSKLNQSDIEDVTRLTEILLDETVEKLDRDLLEKIINSSDRALLVARLEDKIVGMAVATLLVGPAAGRKVYLDDFVTDTVFQGRGIGSKLWEELLAWGREKGAAKIDFTSNPSRTDAHSFYLGNGAIVRDTAPFRKEL